MGNEVFILYHYIILISSPSQNLLHDSSYLDQGESHEQYFFWLLYWTDWNGDFFLFHVYTPPGAARSQSLHWAPVSYENHALLVWVERAFYYFSPETQIYRDEKPSRITQTSLSKNQQMQLPWSCGLTFAAFCNIRKSFPTLCKHLQEVNGLDFDRMCP